jgi:23S rRNA (pseudouridine1915-N3)-methyltransferase
MPIRVIAVGKKHESWVSEGIERYEKRLKAPFLIEWVFMAHSTFEGDRAREEESERIISRLPAHAFIVLLDERGREMDSPTISQLFKEHLDPSQEIVLVIGGAYGVNDQLRAQANVVWSLSPLVFPHQLVRLLVVEQLYRSQQIALGGHYHHE